MTWVFGSAGILGSAICVADIQVTMPDKTTFDCLRKLYPIGDNMVAGFAGDVCGGFRAVDAMQRLVISAGTRPELAHARVVDQLQIAIRETFTQLPLEHRENGLEILIAFAVPVPNRLYGSQPCVVKFTHPDFVPEPSPPGSWVSIGSGNGIEQYRAELGALTTDEARSALLPMEGSNPGGALRAMFLSVLLNVAEMEPQRGISKHFHFATVFAHGIQLGSSDRELYIDPSGQPQPIRMPDVAESFPTLQRMLSRELAKEVTLARAST